MPSSAERADTITDRFNARDNEGAVRAIQDAQAKDQSFWKNHGERINQDVDFKALGFPTDFIIEGVNPRGQLVTTDGDRLQHRTGVDLRVVHQSQASPPGERIGTDGRTVQTDDQGKTTYTIKQGDALDWVARDLVREKTGREATPQEIVAARQAIAKENNLRDVNNIPVGTKLRIPDELRDRIGPADRNEPYRPGQPSRSGLPGDKRPPGDGGVYKPFSPPGVADKNTQWDDFSTYKENQRVQRTPRLENGRMVTEYDTTVEGMRVIGERQRKVNVKDETNPRTGVLEKRTVKYDQPGTNFEVKGADGSNVSLKEVSSVVTTRNSDGTYTTRIQHKSGVYTTRSDASGDTVR
jgi:hypothetical protein